ncbi:MAG TPA: hypothetical protein VGE36_14180 [Roseateles sp.]
MNIKSILNRLREPSTMAGLSVLGLLVGLPPGTVETVGQIVGGVAAVAAVVLPETKAQ